MGIRLTVFTHDLTLSQIMLAPGYVNNESNYDQVADSLWCLHMFQPFVLIATEGLALEYDQLALSMNMPTPGIMFLS